MALRKNPKYDLKKQYKKTLEISLIVSLLSLITAFKYVPNFESGEYYEIVPQEIIQVEDVLNTKQEVKPPPPMKPVIPIDTQLDDEFLEDIELEETELDMNANLSAPEPPKQDDADEVPFEYFAVVEESPVPVGGIGAIQEKIKYPQFAIRAGIQGRVFVKAFVDENGDVQKVEIVKDIGGGCGEEAVKAVMATKFKPGKQRGRAVKVQVTVPVSFQLH